MGDTARRGGRLARTLSVRGLSCPLATQPKGLLTASSLALKSVGVCVLRAGRPSYKPPWLRRCLGGAAEYLRESSLVSAFALVWAWNARNSVLG